MKTAILPGAVLAACFSLAAATTTAYVPVCCTANSTVSVISTARNRIVSSFTAGPGSYAVAFPNLNTAWVTNTSNNTISVVNLVTGAVRKTISLKLTPWLVQASPDGGAVYVVTGMFTGSLNHYSASLMAFNARTFAVTGAVSLPNDGLQNPGLAVSADGGRVYATFDSQTIVVYDVATGTAAATWNTTRAATWTAAGVLTLSPDGGTLYTAGQELTAFDTATGNIKGTLNPPGFAGGYSFVGSAVSADGATLYASYAAQIGTGGGLAVIDTASLTITQSAGLGSEPQQPVVSKDGATVYVPDAYDSVLYAVNAANLAVTASIALPGPIAATTLNANGSALAVANSSTAATVAVDTATLSVIATIGVSGTPNSQASLFGTTNAAAPANGGSVYVGGIEANSISRIDPASNRVTRYYTDGAQSPSVTGVNPPSLMVTPNGQQIYLAGSDFQLQMTEIDTATGAVNGVNCPLGGGCEVSQMAALPDSSRVYLAGFWYALDSAPPFFFVVDTATKKIVAAPKIKVVDSMAASPSGAFLYIVTPTAIEIFDTAQNAVTSTLPIGGVYFAAFSPDGATAYAVTNSALELIDTGTGAVTGSISLGSIAPAALSLTPDGSQAWIPLAKSTSLLVVDLQANSVRTVDLGATVAGVAFGVN
ncbi:MAG TPA: hypothetical protein VMI94_04590 [Bryobacteraceae bacterium]|nr:hypothetical protein [Bryobacteraceae bacterium]